MRWRASVRLKMEPAPVISNDRSEPILFFHGTRSIEPFEISEFQPLAHGTIYFSTNLEYAENFRDPCGDGIVEWTPKGSSRQAVFQVNIRMQNPKIFRGENHDEYESFNYYGFDVAELKAQGHDGAMMKFDDGEIVVAVFDPRQIVAAAPNSVTQGPGLEAFSLPIPVPRLEGAQPESLRI